MYVCMYDCALYRCVIISFQSLLVSYRSIQSVLRTFITPLVSAYYLLYLHYNLL